MDNILTFLISASGISTILIFGVKFAMNQFGKMGIEKYKSELQKEMLEFQNGLEKNFESFKVNYTQLHLDQVEAIKELYKRLIVAEISLEELLRPIKVNYPKKDTEIASEVVKNVNDFFNYFFQNEILFNENSCELIIKIHNQMREAWQPHFLKEFMGDDADRTIKAEIAEKMIKAYDDYIQTQIPALKQELKKDFRKYLGVNGNIEKASY